MEKAGLRFFTQGDLFLAGVFVSCCADRTKALEFARMRGQECHATYGAKHSTAAELRQRSRRHFLYPRSFNNRSQHSLLVSHDSGPSTARPELAALTAPVAGTIQQRVLHTKVGMLTEARSLMVTSMGLACSIVDAALRGGFPIARAAATQLNG